MTDVLKVVKVFLASPGDLQDERRAVKSVVDEFNKKWRDYLGYHVELVGWEDTVSVYGRPQATINRDLERCELFIGMMWKRWGMPPGIDTIYTSGFEEEFETSVIRRQKTGRPEISLFFKKVDAELLADPGVELAKVIQFKERVGPQILYIPFDDTRELEAKIDQCITNYVQRLTREEASTLSGESQVQPSATSLRDSAKKVAAADTPLAQEDADFLREFIDKTEQVSETESITPLEVARFRLFGSLLGVPGNDDNQLGSHDSNIIFQHRSALELSSREVLQLISCGLEHYETGNTPLWYWYAASDGFSRKLLFLSSIVGTMARRTSALRAMTLISETLPSHLKDSRNNIILTWFSKEAPNSLKVAAMAYLGECGQLADLPLIKQEFDGGDYLISGAAANAIIRINLKESRERAIRALYDLQTETLDQTLLNDIFQKSDSLSTELISQGLDHRNSKVRLIVVKLLRARRALTIANAEALLSDDVAEIRFESLQTLISERRSFTDDSVRKILVKPRLSGLLGGAEDPPGEEFWKDFRNMQLQAMSDQELKNAVSGSWIGSDDELFALHERHFDTLGDVLRAAVTDKFVREFMKALEDVTPKFGASRAERVKKVEEALRKNLTQRGLEIICRKGSARDLGIIRDTIRSGFLDYSAVQVEYLRKFGEWEDISLIINLVELRDRSHTLLWTPDNSRYEIAARAIYTIGRTRLDELLQLQMPDRLLSYLVAEASDELFPQLNDATVVGLLRSESAMVRKVVALKCVRSFSKRRLKQLFENYTSDNAQLYYNVVHWLDFGLSAPQDIATHGAAKILAGEWAQSRYHALS